MKLLKRDFDNAVKQPWRSDRCVVAQCMIRNGISVINVNPFDFAIGKALRDVQREFDLNFREPGDEKKPELQALRASLPITI